MDGIPESISSARSLIPLENIAKRLANGLSLERCWRARSVEGILDMRR